MISHARACVTNHSDGSTREGKEQRFLSIRKNHLTNSTKFTGQAICHMMAIGQVRQVRTVCVSN